jgi:cephalosporin hydroxylase
LWRTATGRRLAARAFHHAFYDAREWERSRWLGVAALKTPQDLWIYQEIIYETRPDLIVETGTFNGGSALYLATVCDAIGSGRILSIDLRLQDDLPNHARLEYVAGSSTDPAILARVRDEADKSGRVMVLLDSDHSRDHVLEELRGYGPLVTEGCYLVVEDTNINGHPVNRYWGPGPMEALQAYLSEGAPFTVDRERERFMLSFNPNGFLRRT